MNRIFAEDWEMFEIPSSYTHGIVKLAWSLLAGEMRVEDCNFGPIEVDMKKLLGKLGRTLVNLMD